MPGTSTIIFSGKCDFNKICKLIETELGNLKKGIIPKRKKLLNTDDKFQYILKPYATEQIFLSIAFKTFPINHKKNIILEVLTEILGSGDSFSKLFIELRQKLGLVYYINCDNIFLRYFLFFFL